jgi:hypothetical protein
MIKSHKMGSNFLLVLAVSLGLQNLSLATDPQNYAKMGTELWKTLATRQSANLPPELLPYYIFTDGESLSIVPQAFVAGFRAREASPIKVVVPGPKTSEESHKYPILSLGDFLKKNAPHVNMVTDKNPAQPNMLNIYVSSEGIPTTKENMSKE